jgi:hypothetical protein
MAVQALLAAPSALYILLHNHLLLACAPPAAPPPQARPSVPLDDLAGQLQYSVEVQDLQISVEAEAAAGRLLLAARSGRLQGLRLPDAALNVTALLMEEVGWAALRCAAGGLGAAGRGSHEWVLCTEWLWAGVGGRVGVSGQGGHRLGRMPGGVGGLHTWRQASLCGLLALLAACVL